MIKIVTKDNNFFGHSFCNQSIRMWSKEMNRILLSYVAYGGTITKVEIDKCRQETHLGAGRLHTDSFWTVDTEAPKEAFIKEKN